MSSITIQLTYASVHLFLAAVVLAITCEPGTFVSEGSCKTCPLGRVSMIANATACSTCPIGEVPPNLVSGFVPGGRFRTAPNRCEPCLRGYFYRQSPSPSCIACPFNNFASRRGSLSCRPCPDGQISTKRNRRKSNCGVCPIGTVVRFSTEGFHVACAKCPNGQSSLTTNALRCTRCPRGMFRFVLPINRSRRLRFRLSVAPVRGNTVCEHCRPGSFASRTGMGHCSLCPPGTFQDEPGASSCKLCPPGSNSTEPGAQECQPTCAANTSGCVSCPPGKEINLINGKCQRCPLGMVSRIRSATPCFPCLSGEGVPNSAGTNCVCKTGFRLRKVDQTCQACPSRLVALNGQVCMCEVDGADKDCRCPPRTKKVGNKCKICDVETDPLCQRCQPGMFVKQVGNTSVCERCPAGTISTQIDAMKCDACPEGTTSDPSRGINMCRCAAGYGRRNGACEPCPPGRFSPAANERCFECRSRTFSSEAGAERCRPCPGARSFASSSCSTQDTV